MAKSASIITSLSKEFECSICMDRLKNPKCLFCQHVFCHDCLESCAQSGRETANHITCPVCREVTRMPRGGVGGLKSNALIKTLLEKLEEWEMGSGAQSSAANRTSCKNCPEHPGTVAKYYCTDCDRICCQKCVDQRRHKIISLQQKAASIKISMGHLVDQCQEKNFMIQTNHHQVNVNKDQTLEAINSLKVEVRQKAQKMASKIKTQEDDLLRRLDAMKQRVVEVMSVKQNSCCDLEEGLETAVQEWTALRQSGNDAEIIGKYAAVKSRMQDQLKSLVTPSDPDCQLLESSLHFVPGELYLQMTSGSVLGDLQMKRNWNRSAVVTTTGVVSKLMYKSDGELVICYLNNGIEIMQRDLEHFSTLFENGHYRDLAVLSNDDLVLQDDKNRLFLVKDGQAEISRELGRFDRQWVSIAPLHHKRPLIAVANKNMHDQEIIIMDTTGRRTETNTTAYFHGFLNMTCDRNRRVLFIDIDRKGIQWPNLRNGGHMRLQIAQEGRMYLTVACNQSGFVYVAWQTCDVPNVINITKHSLDDGRELETIVREFRVQNSFRMTMANWGDQELAFSTGGDIEVVRSVENAKADALLNQF